MDNQAFILSYILTEFEKRIVSLNWSGLKVFQDSSKLKENEVGIEVKIFDVNSNIYQNVNDKVRVNGKLIPKSLPVCCSIVLFVTSENHNNQLKAFGIILRSLRDNRKMDVGEYNWLNNEDSPLTIDSIDEPDLHTKFRIQEYWNKVTSLTLFFKVNCCIDSEIAVDFVEVKERKIQMEKIDAK